MSAEKLQAVHEALSKMFSESPLISTHTEPSRPVFDDEALSEIFSEPHPVSTNTEKPSPIFDHAALAGIFSEPLPISTDTKPSPPSFDHQALAETLSEFPPISTNTRLSPPSFDHQALADILSELPPVPINPELSPLSFDTGSSSAPFSGQLDSEEPVAKAVAVASSTNEGARTQRTKSLLAKLHDVFSTKAEPPSSSVEEDPSPPSLSGQLHKPEPMAKAIAAASPAEKSLPTEFRPLTSASAEPALIVEKKPSQPTLSGRVGNLEPAVKTVAAAPSPDAESARTQQARLLVEPVSPRATNMDPSAPVLGKEPSRPVLSGRPDVEPAESARPQQVNSSLTELPPLISTKAKPPAPVLETEPSQPILSGQPDNLEPAVNAAPTDAESAGVRQEKSSLTEHPLISITTETSGPIRENETSRPPLSNQLDNLQTAAKAVSVAPPTDAESAVMQPREAKPLLSAVTSLDSTNTKTPPGIFENESSPISLSGRPNHAEPTAKIVPATPSADMEDARPQQRESLLAELTPSRFFFRREPSSTTLSGELDNVAPAVKTVAVVPPTHALAMLPQQMNSLPLTDLPALTSTNTKPSPPISEENSSPPSLSGQLENVEPAAKAVAVTPPADTVNAVTRAQQAKSLLAELDLSTAIRLRWVMRDIRSKRTKLSPVSDNDLTALVDLGLVEMREELPRLTALGVLALD
jgi:hypothetical protein